MLTKDFIDELYNSSNGALTREELLKKANTYQNWMLGRNCTEMEIRDTFTLAAEITSPVYQSFAVNYTDNYSSAAVDYVPGDAFQVVDNFPAGGGAVQSYYRVLVPFTSAVATFNSDLVRYCTPVTNYEIQRQLVSTVAYETGVVIPRGVTIAYDGDYYVGWQPLTCTGDFLVDCDTAKLYPVLAKPAISGTVVDSTEAVPTYVELTGLREVVLVGLKDSNNEWSQLYDVRIEQSTDPSLPVKVYTDGLPEGVPISYQGYRWPAQLTSEAVTLEIPVAHQEGLLRTMIQKSIEEANYGNSVYWAQLQKTQEGDWYNYINRAKQAAPRSRKEQKYNFLGG